MRKNIGGLLRYIEGLKNNKGLLDNIEGPENCKGVLQNTEEVPKIIERISKNIVGEGRQSAEFTRA